ncbi:MAG: HpcH/HpaI aldolase/citrate lyase family protein, partial [Geminicoccaceae bacterium]|nr:HpcH/HpaI aldolase/citrate lyase family protein [Geminicoccaceae bacterium]
IDALDGVMNDFRDAEAFESECIEGRNMGFDGKTLIHPKQIAAANDTFGPTDDAIQSAKRIIEAYAEALRAGKGVTVLDGKLVENLHVAEAERIVALAEAIADRAGA